MFVGVWACVCPDGQEFHSREQRKERRHLHDGSWLPVHASDCRCSLSDDTCGQVDLVRDLVRVSLFRAQVDVCQIQTSGLVCVRDSEDRRGTVVWGTDVRE